MHTEAPEVKRASIRKSRARAGLAFLFGLTPLAFTANVSAQETDVLDFVRATYIEGTPYDVANAYTTEAVPTLLEMLRSEDEKQYWANIAVTLSIIGDERAVNPLIDFVQGNLVDGNPPDWLYHARANAVTALGYLVNKSDDEKALSYLLEWVDPESWRDVPWLSDAEERRADLSTMAILGLALSGRDEAAVKLDSMLESESMHFRPGLTGLLEEAREALTTVSEVGLSEYYRRSRREFESPALMTAQEPAAGDAVPPFAPVTWERLVNAADEPHNWLMYNGTLDSKRFSRLDQVDRTNVADLELKWAYNIRQLDRTETTPLVVDGVMFITESPSNVTAVDATTGRPFWRYEHPLPDDLRICCGRNNRGVAILGETLYMSTLDAHLVAIDARTGNLVWDAEVADYRGGYSKTAAPLIVKDRVVTGIAGGEFGIRGFLDSYDAETGERAWRTYTIPGPDHPDNQTWLGDSWRTGGSPTWITGSYDPELNLVYWGTGNPGPDYGSEMRLGDNLYSDSVLALDGDTGEMRWYFQFTPHDVHDWDAIQIPVLADIEFEGEPRKAMLWANRNAFYYTFDRETGEFLLGKPFALQTWAEGLDENGRPIRVPGMFPSPEGTVVAPTAGGATNWWSPAFNPRTGLLYVNSFDGEGEFFLRDEEYVEGERYTGGGVQSPQPMDNYRSAIRAIDPTTGDVRWEFEMKPRARSGVLATAGGILFSATVDGYFFALDAESGEELWHIPLGGPVNANPMTYAVDGRQYVTMSVGNTVYTFGLGE